MPDVPHLPGWLALFPWRQETFQVLISRKFRSGFAKIKKYGLGDGASRLQWQLRSSPFGLECSEEPASSNMPSTALTSWPAYLNPRPVRDSSCPKCGFPKILDPCLGDLMMGLLVLGVHFFMGPFFLGNSPVQGFMVCSAGPGVGACRGVQHSQSFILRLLMFAGWVSDCGSAAAAGYIQISEACSGQLSQVKSGPLFLAPQQQHTSTSVSTSLGRKAASGGAMEKRACALGSHPSAYVLPHWFFFPVSMATSSLLCCNRGHFLAVPFFDQADASFLQVSATTGTHTGAACSLYLVQI